MINVGGTWEVAGISNYIFYDNTVSGSDPNPYFAFGISGCSAADLTDPGVRGWINGTVPEPASLIAVGLGVLGIARRRRKRPTK